MRQRIKMAAALVHDPAVLLLDEPFNGVDPRQRMHLMELLQRLGAEGRTVLFSSHILEEVEQVARQIEVVVSGRHAASGDFGAIRRLMTDRPDRFVVLQQRRPRPRRRTDRASVGARASRCARAAASTSRSATSVSSRAACPVARAADVRLLEVAPTDESLESVFSYLVSS